MEVCYIRHQKQTSHSLDPPIVQGDILTFQDSKDKGKYDIVISSPYLRTRMTALKIENNKELIIDHRISEYQGHKKNIKGSFDSKTKDYDPPIKESFEDFSKRVREHLRCMDEIKKEYFSSSSMLDVKILVVTHGIVVKHIREILLENKSSWRIKGTKKGNPKKYKRGRDVPFLEGIILY